MKPTICRMVEYTYVDPAEPHVAVITKVTKRPDPRLNPDDESSYEVELYIIVAPTPYFRSDTPFSSTRKPGHWTWPTRV